MVQVFIIQYRNPYHSLPLPVLWPVPPRPHGESDTKSSESEEGKRVLTMSESNIMMVNPNEIVIDMPVDEQNVTQKMESMKERGIIQPVTLWLQGMRVIDGFHRSVAAQRLGWTEIPCYVVDCSEDAFWDARIQS